MSQNIYDNSEFFEDFKKKRFQADSYNNLIEQPAIMPLLPDLAGKLVLDIGCGFGFNCMDFVEMGAARVLGIDISENMLEVARTENTHENIEYMRLGMEQLDKIDGKFDLVYSSLAVSYAEDFKKLVSDVYGLLNEGGTFLFSQEHPLATAPIGGVQWIRDGAGKKTAGLISDYLTEGERLQNWWIIDGVMVHHRPLSTIINTLINTGFVITKVVEPAPTRQTLEINPSMYDEIHRPTSIIFKTRKEA